ncbi:MAG: response regulator [Bacteriovoracaceae bacterium]
MNFLVIDDSKHVHSVVQSFLEKKGIKCYSAFDGQLAVKAITDKLANESKHYDLILLDWNMPNMTGPEFLEHVKETKLTTCPIVMMTTENSIEKITFALENGAIEYIMKPFTEDILLNKIEFVIGSLAA